jgi:hypothetical protein
MANLSKRTELNVSTKLGKPTSLGKRTELAEPTPSNEATRLRMPTTAFRYETPEDVADTDYTSNEKSPNNIKYGKLRLL